MVSTAIVTHPEHPMPVAVSMDTLANCVQKVRLPTAMATFIHCVHQRTPERSKHFTGEILNKCEILRSGITQLVKSVLKVR